MRKFGQIFQAALCENFPLNKYFGKLLTIFPRKVSQKSAEISCHQDISTKMVPLFHMLPIRLTKENTTFLIFREMLTKIFVLFVHFRKQFSRNTLPMSIPEVDSSPRFWRLLQKLMSRMSLYLNNKSEYCSVHTLLKKEI
jgi:hypothetical protein